MRTAPLAAAAAVVLALAAPARAQDAAADTAPTAEPRTGLQKDAWSISFASLGQGERGQFSIWKMVGNRTNLGIAVEASVVGREREQDDAEIDEGNTGVGLGLNLRRYAGAERAVMPFVQGGVFVRGGFGHRDGETFEDEVRLLTLGAEGGVGAEWFPTRHFSLSGHTGARLSAIRYKQDFTSSDGTEHQDRWDELALQAFTSTISVAIYF